MNITKAKLEEHEIEILREIAQINCNGVSCDYCPLKIRFNNGLSACTVDTAVTCLKTNNINPYERVKEVKHGQKNN